MGANSSKQAFGLILVLIGTLWLLEKFDLIRIAPELVVASLFLLAGIMMFVSYSTAPQTWKLFVGMLLVFISVPIFNEALDWFADEMIGAIFLWMLGGAFWWVYARDHSQWWAIIPGGILISSGVVVVNQALLLLDEAFLPALFFLGLALTFFYLYFIRNPLTKTGWAIWPAGISLTIAAIIVFTELHWFELDVMDYLVPTGMIGVGIYLVHRSYTRSNDDTGEIIQPPESSQ